MRRLLSILLVLSVAGVLTARTGMQQPAAPAGEKKLIDLKSDLMGPVAPGDSVLFLTGNFAAQHNGAVITCDSAVRYSDMHIEFFGHVLINKNTTYIYGERAVYDGTINRASVFSNLVKVIDGDATLYTYQFNFDTKKNIGEFSGGGVLVNRDNVLEADHGYYYADTKEVIAVDEVEMRNDTYELKGDSVVYNMASDNAHFYDRTNIWNKDGDYLYADRGSFRKSDSLYLVTRNGYVLTDKQEMWSDSIDYYRMREHVILRNGIQIDDSEHKVLAFGDYGEYWKNPGNAFLTRRPSVVSYDTEKSDSLFMRSDSMYLFTFNRNALRRAAVADSLARHRLDSLHANSAPSVVEPTGEQHGVNNAGNNAGVADEKVNKAVTDSLQRKATADSLAAADTVKLTPAQQKAKLKEAAKKAREEKKIAAAKAKKEKLDQIAKKRREKANALLDKQKAREEARLKVLRLKEESKLKARQARAARKGKVFVADSTALNRVDSLMKRRASDTLPADSTRLDSLKKVQPADSVDSAALTPVDSIYRLMKGFHHVKIYRSDFQAVCDSITAISIDSTIHLYIEPVLWNEQSQITSDSMTVFTKNQQITEAKFIGTPFMISEIDTNHYNQITGKEMTSFFRDNHVYRNDVNGNVQTIYYMQDGEPPKIVNVGVLEAGNASFFIEENQVVKIVYRQDDAFHIYPLQKVPPEQELTLKGFKWEKDRRPVRKDVFDRSIRPSERKERSSLTRPGFPIQQRINDYRKQLMDQRIWYDRSEHVDEETVEWMRTLGYEVGKPRPKR